MLKFSTDAMVMAKTFGEEITLKMLGGWAQAGLGNAINAERTGAAYLPFSYYVQRYWLSGQLMNVGNEMSASFKKRGWHHRDKFDSYTPKRSRSNASKWIHTGFHDGSHSLNYLMKNFRKSGNERGISKAWTKWQGNKNTKEELNWMLDRGLDKLFRQDEAERRRALND